MIRKRNFEWVFVSLVAGVAISLAIAWVTSWVFTRSEDHRVFGDTRNRVFANGPGSEDNRWTIDMVHHPFGVYMSEIENREGRAFHPSLVRDRTGPGSIPHWSRARSVPDEKIYRYKYDSVLDGQSYWYKKVTEVAAGWPFTSWKGEWRTKELAGSAENWYCIPVKKPGVRLSILLPLMPVFPGALFNAIFWGGVFFVFTTDTKRSVLFFVRHRRRRRGLCPHCAYDITGLTTCPECGQSVAAKA